jgi:predicted ATPase
VNFRAIEDVEATFDAKVSVIIGPNAVGKTTVLDAIRLAKAVLAPRTANEANQVLIALGAVSPHLPQRLLASALTNRQETPLQIKCRYVLAEDDVARIRSLGPQLANSMAQQNAGIAFQNPAQAMGFLNSPMGTQAVAEARRVVDSELKRIDSDPNIHLNLKIDFKTGLIGEFPVQQILFAALEQGLPPNEAMFSYFPADRALPLGEQPVQLGLADTTQQLESYNSQPQLKYNRLKNAIFNSIVHGASGRADLRKQFQLIFERILRGKELGEIGVNELGMLSIPIKDLESGATFQIDGLSSGEKGLILTFLLIAQNVHTHGIVLLDEPELHLNPAVCRDLLQFFVDEFATKKDIQGIICSHSAEILAGTFERPSCSLFHLRDGKALANVRYQDHGEIRDALRRLGSSESEALLYKGSVSVEGIHDVELLQSGFVDLFRRFRVRDRGGRTQIDHDIRELQKAETNSEDIGYHYFIFDLDSRPHHLSDSAHIKILQWDRYCLENFLLDAEILTDLSRNEEYSDSPKSTVTEMHQVMKHWAMSQLNENAARLVFIELGLEKVGFEMKPMRLGEPTLIANGLWRQIDEMMNKFDALKADGFEKVFEKLFSERKLTLQAAWEEKWQVLSNGKQLFEDLRKAGHLRGDLLKLKRAIIVEMRSRETDVYKALASKLRGFVGMK